MRMISSNAMITLGLSILVFISGSALAGEWQTTSGQLCIDKCAYHYDEYYYYWCHVSDPTLYYSDRNVWGGWGYNDNSPDTNLKWDYCIPSELDASDEVSAAAPNSGKPTYNNQQKDDQNWNDNQQSDGKNNNQLDWNNQNNDDYHDGQDGHDNDNDGTINDEFFDTTIIHPKGAMSALYRTTPCIGPCLFNGPRGICPVDSNHPLVFLTNNQRSFYCVDERMPMRQQLSGQYRLWCQDQCRKETRDHFWCNTLYGPDHCSQRPNIGSEGRPCSTPCERYESTFSEYFFCYTRRDNSSWEYCGMWDVPMEKKTVIEFTRYDYVCADYCREDEDQTYEWCYHTYWNYNFTTNDATLEKTWDYCRGHVPPGLEGWEILLIVLGVMAGVAGLSAGVYFCTK